MFNVCAVLLSREVNLNSAQMLNTMLLSSKFLETNLKVTIGHFSGVPFPKNFMLIAKTILKRLFRVYAHIYHQHFR